jgi:membrane-associated phospholipid phosphatase
MRLFHKTCILILLFFPIYLFAAKESKVGFVKNIQTTIYIDYLNFYSPKNLKYLLVGFFMAGISANTNIDRDIRDWYQQSIRNYQTDQFSKIVKPIGNIYEPLSIYAGLTLLGSITKNTTLGTTAYKIGSRSLRAIIVGAPMVGILQYGLGASRPYEGSSKWHPFHDTNSVSGHAFMGAVPFLTISKIVQPEYLKMFFYIGSFATGLSRINDNKHYFSQVAFGWWISFLSVNSMDISEKSKIEIDPVYFGDGWRIRLCLTL